MLTWASVLLLGVGSYLLRLAGLVVISHGDVPPWAREPLRLLPPAILAALTVSLLVAPSDAPLGPRLVGVLLAGLLLLRRTSLAIAMLLAAGLTALLRLVWM